jgi:hypothetical protein
MEQKRSIEQFFTEEEQVARVRLGKIVVETGDLMTFEALQERYNRATQIKKLGDICADHLIMNLHIEKMRSQGFVWNEKHE